MVAHTTTFRQIEKRYSNSTSTEQQQYKMNFKNEKKTTKSSYVNRPVEQVNLTTDKYTHTFTILRDFAVDIHEL